MITQQDTLHEFVRADCADLAFQSCLRLLQLNELSSELGNTILGSLHAARRVAVLSNDLEDALNALHAVGTLLRGGLQPGKQLLGGLPRISGCLCIPAMRTQTLIIHSCVDCTLHVLTVHSCTDYALHAGQCGQHYWLLQCAGKCRPVE